MPGPFSGARGAAILGKRKGAGPAPTPTPSPTPSMAGILDAYLFDPADITKFKQDSAGTTAVAANGDPIGKALDLSSNARHITQATSANRPLYKTSGGKAWIEGDGGTQFLSASFTLAQPWSRASAFRLITGAVTNDCIMGGAASNDSGAMLASAISAPNFTIALYDNSVNACTATLALDTDYIALEYHNAGISTLKIYDKTGVSVASVSGNPGASGVGGFSLFAGSVGTQVPPARFYGGGAKTGAFTTQNETDLIAALVARIP